MSRGLPSLIAVCATTLLPCFVLGQMFCICLLYSIFVIMLQYYYTLIDIHKILQPFFFFFLFSHMNWNHPFGNFNLNLPIKVNNPNAYIFMFLFNPIVCRIKYITIVLTNIFIGNLKQRWTSFEVALYAA